MRKKVDRKDKKCHLDFVWLAPSEHAHLVQLLGKVELDRWILELNGYIGAKGKDPYESHYYTIQNWARREAAKKGATSGSAAQRSADRVLGLLKDPTNPYMPSDEPLRSQLHKFLLAKKMNWPQLRAWVRESPERERDIRAEISAGF